MSVLLKRRTLLTALLPLVAAGCGGGSSSSGPALSASRGTATVVLALPVPTNGSAAKAVSRNKFPPISLPPYAGNIPFGTNAVSVSLTNPTTGAQITAPRLVTVPTSGISLAPQLTVPFTGLPLGPVHVAVTAFSDAQGASPALAVGAADAQISVNTTASVSVSMTLTADHLVANMKNVFVNVDSPRMLVSVQVLDKNNNAAPFTVQFLAADPDVIAVTSMGFNQASISAGSVRGTTQIEAYEPNSGLNTIISVTNQ